jgi:hypothetical protein
MTGACLTPEIRANHSGDFNHGRENQDRSTTRGRTNCASPAEGGEGLDLGSYGRPEPKILGAAAAYLPDPEKAIGYDLDASVPGTSSTPHLVHVWMEGDVYSAPRPELQSDEATAR